MPCGSHARAHAHAHAEGVPSLYAVESVDSRKLADALEAAAVRVGRTEPLHVFVQANTSGEACALGEPPAALSLSNAR